MLTTAIVLFALAAIAGITLLTFVLRTKQTPRSVMVIHGLLAAIALLLVILIVAKGASPSPDASMIIFIIAALGGFTLLTIDLMKKTLPKWLAVIHALVAVLGFILLLIFVL